MGANYDAPDMHGNHLSLQPNHDAISGGVALWFGLPAAQREFDPALLTEADRARLLAHRHSRRLQEFKVSRALKVAANADAQAFSLSHSGGHAALLTAPIGMRVGVDLEVARERDVLKIARFSFSPDEVAWLQAQPLAEHPRIFYTLWTMKEALTKALDLNLMDALRHCVFRQAATGWIGEVPTDSDWSAHVFEPRTGFFLAAARVGQAAPSGIETLEWPPRAVAHWPVIASAAAPSAAAAPRA
jgi:phosphopantetheinyl transferase